MKKVLSLRLVMPFIDEFQHNSDSDEEDDDDDEIPSNGDEQYKRPGYWKTADWTIHVSHLEELHIIGKSYMSLSSYPNMLRQLNLQNLRKLVLQVPRKRIDPMQDWGYLDPDAGYTEFLPNLKKDCLDIIDILNLDSLRNLWLEGAFILDRHTNMHLDGPHVKCQLQGLATVNCNVRPDQVAHILSNSSERYFTFVFCLIFILLAESLLSLVLSIFILKVMGFETQMILRQLLVPAALVYVGFSSLRLSVL